MRTVFINGCFDILHRGHLELFKYGASLGTTLIVAIDSDEKVKAAKGPDRPINNVEDRKFMLSSLRYVDHVEVFNTPDELEGLIKSTAPDIMIVGSDWKGKTIVGGHWAREIKYFERIDGYSTTKIIESITDR
jgi:rfaE bifunctional protein nucleotidyltransferase chain/domain